MREDLVFAYGGPSASLSRFDGRSWHTEQGPPGIRKMHGTEPSLLYAVGDKGLIARYDGTRWSEIEGPGEGAFRDVHVASADRIYAIHETGLFEGSADQWRLCVPAKRGELRSVVVWRDQVWVGVRGRGLCRLEAGTLRPAKPNLTPESMDARDSLVLVQKEYVAGTHDGTVYTAWRLAQVIELWDKMPAPHWLA